MVIVFKDQSLDSGVWTMALTYSCTSDSPGEGESDTCWSLSLTRNEEPGLRGREPGPLYSFKSRTRSAHASRSENRCFRSRNFPVSSEKSEASRWSVDCLRSQGWKVVGLGLKSGQLADGSVLMTFTNAFSLHSVIREHQAFNQKIILQ